MLVSWWATLMVMDLSSCVMVTEVIMDSSFCLRSFVQFLRDMNGSHNRYWTSLLLHSERLSQQTFQVCKNFQYERNYSFTRRSLKYLVPEYFIKEFFRELYIDFNNPIIIVCTFTTQLQCRHLFCELTSVQISLKYTSYLYGVFHH